MRTVDPEDLLVWAGPLRQLARQLVADEARADDVVQETWLAALRRPPAEGRNLRGWLFAVARNAARRSGREETRRQVREERNARPETIVDDAAERAATQRELTDLVLGLEEPYRAVLLLRYFEDLPPRRIATILDVPVATVNTRIRRARERLRESLERRYGDRDAWCEAMVGLVLGTPMPRTPWLRRPEAWRYLVPLALLAGSVGLGCALWPWGPDEAGNPVVVPPPVEDPEELAPPGHVDEPPPDEESHPPRLTEKRRSDPEEDEYEEVVVEPGDPPGEVAIEGLGDPEETGESRRDDPGREARGDDPPREVAERDGGSSRSAATVVFYDRPPLRGYPTPRGDDGAPPGLVSVEGGPTKIGTSVKDVAPLILANEQQARALAGETPRHTVKIPDCYLMPTEVTVEQYGAYVLATGVRPPWYWGAAAVDGARAAFLQEQGRRAQEARDQGIPFAKNVFDPAAWWDEHWRDSEWTVPADLLDRPVFYVSYRDAEAYAGWAGLRLMSEFEYQRAARRDTDRVYPWGDEFDASACASILSGTPGAVPVGTYPKGSVEGMYELVGNVWEWTSSPYRKFPDYKPVRVMVPGPEDRAIEAIAPFDSNQRVLVGGSFQQNQVGTRITTRMFAERNQATDALGFRCAASLRSGIDAANALVRIDVDKSVLPQDHELYVDGTVVLERWHSAPGFVGKAGRVPGYAVITDYERVLLTPIRGIAADSAGEFEHLTEFRGPAFLGLLSIDSPVLQPALEPGSYHVAFVAAGVLAQGLSTAREKALREDSPLSFLEGVDVESEADFFLFFDLEGKPRAAMAAEKPYRYDLMRGDSEITLEPWTLPFLHVRDEPPVPMDTLRIRFAVAGRRGSNGFHFELPLGIEPGAIDETWQ